MSIILIFNYYEDDLINTSFNIYSRIAILFLLNKDIIFLIFSCSLDEGVYGIRLILNSSTKTITSFTIFYLITTSFYFYFYFYFYLECLISLFNS